MRFFRCFDLFYLDLSVFSLLLSQLFFGRLILLYLFPVYYDFFFNIALISSESVFSGQFVVM